jgi:hypothetical protein
MLSGAAPFSMTASGAWTGEAALLRAVFLIVALSSGNRTGGGTSSPRAEAMV